MCYKCVRYDITHKVKMWWLGLKIRLGLVKQHPEYFSCQSLNAINPMWLLATQVRPLPIGKGKTINFLTAKDLRRAAKRLRARRKRAKKTK